MSAHTVLAEERLVWNPDAGGSVAFLISAAFVYVGYFRERDTLWEPGRSEWWAAHINMLGCIAFGVSAVGAFILSDGSTENAMLANWGTLIGALCFFFSSASSYLSSAGIAGLRGGVLHSLIGSPSPGW